ncbi:hypothetical protein MSAN_00112000 [Mycena sanguinolenta]|uniref:Uncharacterized protein n=1 Tax=Mycena sanguinolenta TaxID=230812 RepID=A0A8H6ZGF7_9AGAR|nr:hypothetical protein MSAN_00112000 [Mycena sanguinolenta]
MFCVAALAVLYGTASFARIGAARVRTRRVAPVDFTDALDTRQTFNVDPNDDSLSNDSTIMGLNTVQFASTLTGLALIVIGTIIWLCYRERKKRMERTRVPDPEFYAPAFIRPITQVPPPPPPSVPTRPERSLSLLKREQTAAIPRYADTHTEPDVLVQTADGLQLLPGSSPPRKGGYRPFWRVSNGSSK